MSVKKSDRAIAVAVLSEILEEGAYANIALRKALSSAEASGASAQARAFITEMVNETLRNLILIDHIIESFSTTPTSEMKPFIRNLLRISVCQIRFLDRIPERAAVNEAVVIAKAFGFERLTGFVNGILRNIAREPEKPAYSPKDLSIRFSYPPWLVNSLVKWLGGKGAIAFCENSHLPAPITILANTHKTDINHLTELLESEGVEVTPVENVPEMLSLRHTGDIAKLSAFRDGLFLVTDPGAMAAVNALNPQAGQTIIDLCAAPGGKSFAAAFRMKNNGRVIALDIHKHRVELIRQTRKRLDVTIVEPNIHDAMVYNPALLELADAVLLDAPCSGLGTIRKHPEIKLTRQPEDIQILARKQLQMLSNAAKYVKAGGILVYCTCTVTTEENMDIIEKFTSTHPSFQLESASQTLPCATSDGFFTAKLIKLC